MKFIGELISIAVTLSIICGLAYLTYKWVLDMKHPELAVLCLIWAAIWINMKLIGDKKE